MTHKQLIHEYSVRTMFMPIVRRDKRGMRVWDKLSRAQRDEQHRRIESICKQLERDKCESAVLL